MKKIFIFLTFFCFSFTLCFADNEKIVFVDGSGATYDAFQLNTYAFTPCQSAKFRVTYNVPPIPAGYYSLCKVDWYDQAYNIYQTTTTNEITLPVKSDLQIVACRVYYGGVGCSNQVSYAVGGVTLHVLNIALTTPSQVSGTISGCTNPVSFSTTLINDAQHTVPAANSYLLKWNLPSGWSNTPQALTTSVTPDALSSGNVSTTLTLNACPYTVTSPVLAVTRTTQAPSFSATTYFVCTGTTNQTYSINPICGASNYTYIIQGNTGCLFTSNNLQTLTTTANSVSVTFPSTSFSIILSAIANFPVGSSTAGSTNIISGAPTAPTNLRLSSLTCPEYTYNCDYVSPFTYNWSYYNPITHLQTNLVFTSGMAKIVFPTNGSYNIGVSRSNTCGTSPVTFITTNVTCSLAGSGHRTATVKLNESTNVGQYNNIRNLTVYPNPASDNFTIDMGSSLSNLQKNNLSGIKSIMIYNQLGKLVISHKYSGSQKSINVSTKNLISGIYTVKTLIGEIEKISQLVINRK